jgi:hypothetical protein
MSVIRIGGFRGELPRIHKRLLPEGSAQTALNCRLDTGALEAVRDTENLQPTTLSSPISLHRYSESVWLEATTDVDWVPYPIENDQYGRLIYADPAASELRVTDATLVGAGGYPAAYYRLDVPAPTQGFSATLVGTADDEEEVPETRYYVCTFVNSWGAEGPPSPPTNQIEWRDGQTVLLEGLPSLSGNYNITHRRIYRLNTGSTGGTNYQYVSEVAVAQATSSITAITNTNPVAVTTTLLHGFSDGQEVTFLGLGSETPVNISSISKASPCRVTASGHGFVNGQTIELSNLGGGNGMDELDGTRTVIVYVDENRFDLTGVDSSAFVTYVSGGTAAVAHGMDELNGNSYVVQVTDATNFSLLGIDGTAYKTYIDEGQVRQVSGTSYNDGIPSASLAEVIPTDLYDPPNSATTGVKEHPAGFLVGFFGNTLAFSEPGAPHAWPIDYRLVTSYDIVGVGVFGNTVAIVTKGWPYLAIGSDPGAMSLVELEIEQACVAKRGIVDFGAAIAYPSPDGLIVLGSDGATNATSGIFRRDQWQELVPTSFEAYNWEQLYLCFYDDGGVTRAFVIDPFDPAAGVRYIDRFATGGYKDLEEDLLYLIINDQIEKWDESTDQLEYTWKSKPTYTPRSVNMSSAKLIADDYPVTAEFYVDDVKRYTKVVHSIDAFRLPGGFRGEKFVTILKGKNKVSEIIMATTMRELSVTV